MRFAVVVLACVLTVVNAQANSGRYTPDNGRYQYNKFNPTNQYNRFNNNQYNRYNNNQYNPFNNRNQYTPFTVKPFVSTTPYARPSVTVTPAPPVFPTVTPAPVSPFVPAVTPTPFKGPVIAAAKYAADARSAETVKYGNEINPDGSYSYFYETNNGIAAQAQGVPRNFGGNPPLSPVVSDGSFSWYSPEGKLIAINWVADENGYQASGDAIPQPPPLPDQIARAFAYIARTAPVSAVARASTN